MIFVKGCLNFSNLCSAIAFIGILNGRWEMGILRAKAMETALTNEVRQNGGSSANKSAN